MSILVHFVKKDRPNECDICFKSFAIPYDLETHKMIHTGKKQPLNCDICKRRFLKPNSVDSHRRGHFKERPFVCEICQKTFVNKKALKIFFDIYIF